MNINSNSTFNHQVPVLNKTSSTCIESRKEVMSFVLCKVLIRNEKVPTFLIFSRS